MRKSWVRVGITLAMTILAISAIGFGGLAGWSISTTNPSNSFATGTLHMSNSAGTACTDTGGTCTAILTATGMKPGSTATGSVTITNTGTLAGAYSLVEGNPPTDTNTTLCGQLDLTVTQGTTTLINGTDLVSEATATATTPVPLGTLAASTGATTLNFSVTLNAGDTNADMNQTCTAAFIFSAIP